MAVEYINWFNSMKVLIVSVNNALVLVKSGQGDCIRSANLHIFYKNIKSLSAMVSSFIMFKIKKKEVKIMGSKEFIEKCKEIVKEYAKEHLDKSDNIPEFEVFDVWYCKTLQNHKALLSTTLFDGMYYELTYNGDKKELYFDAYKKFENRCIKLD